MRQLSFSLNIGPPLENCLSHRQNVAMRRLNNISPMAVSALLSRYQLQISQVAADCAIPYSFWGTPEAGRNLSTLYVRADTPIHSILHEAAHYICMPAAQRDHAQIDAMGSTAEENACCYLQIVLADHIQDMSRHILMHDMDQWGYSFRLGSTARWFYADSTDTRQWLIEQQILSFDNQPTWKLR